MAAAASTASGAHYLMWFLALARAPWRYEYLGFQLALEIVDTEAWMVFLTMVVTQPVLANIKWLSRVMALSNSTCIDKRQIRQLIPSPHARVAARFKRTQ